MLMNNKYVIQRDYGREIFTFMFLYWLCMKTLSS